MEFNVPFQHKYGYIRDELEAKDVLPNISCTQAAERAKKCRFMSLVTLTFKLARSRDQTHLPYEYGANPFSGSGDISHTNKKVTGSDKSNLTQFTR